MTTPLSYPLVNGNRHAWASVEIKLAGLIFYCTAINYARKRNREMVRLNHPDPVGKTIGENDYTGDCEMLVAEYNAFQAALIAQASAQGLNGGYGDIRFPAIVTYTENGFDTIVDTLIGCTMDSTDAAGAQGPNAIKRKFDLSPLKILFNGQDDLATPLGAPPAG